jgi:PIN domain nuclease of toxin-antitoxin system
VSGSGWLFAGAKHAIERGARERALVPSAITVLEIATAMRCRRFALGVPLDPWLADLYTLPELQFVPVSAAIAQLAGGLDESMPRDTADRIIAATALTLGVDLVTGKNVCTSACASRRSGSDSGAAGGGDIVKFEDLYKRD